MQFLRRWLDLRGERRPLALRPCREIAVPLDYDATFDRVLTAVERRLGANLTGSDRAGGTIEAAFGLVNNERVRCFLHAVDSERTNVRIEALLPVGVSHVHSAAVDALADELER